MTAPEPIAVIGSPSDCSSAVLNLLKPAFGVPLLGKMLLFRNDYNDGSTELALGTVTAIQTVNPEMAPSGRLGTHIAAGKTTAASASDTRSVSVKVEAVFRETDEDRGTWRRHSSTLSNSPHTGTVVRELDQSTANELMAEAERPAFIGTLRGSSVQVPYTLRDFSGPRGSFHSATLGSTGSGKSTWHAYALANDLRWPTKGHLIVDPQGQWSSEVGLPFSLQGLAAACGRTVNVARLSQSLRLRKDAPLFLTLLDEAGWFRNLAFGAGADENVASARRTMEAALRDQRAMTRDCGTADWTEADPRTLMRYLLTLLHDVLPTGTIYAGRDQQERVQRTIRLPRHGADGEPIDPAILDRLPPGALDEGGEATFDRLLAPFMALHSLWSPVSPTGRAKLDAGARLEELDGVDRRRDAWSLIREVIAPSGDGPAPWLVLDLSADMTHFDGLHGEGDVDPDIAAAARLLDDPDVKARIMKQLLTTLELVGQQEYSRGRTLNVAVDIDEAHRWAGQPDPKSSSAARVELSQLLARMHREVRKFGIGFSCILQTATGLNEEIWKQISTVFVGYGLLDTAELKRLAGRVPDAHLDLYRASPPPEATGRYPWMLIGGGVTGLSFGQNPVFVEAFNDPGRWLEANAQWITETRRQFAHLLPAGDTGGPLRSFPARPAHTDEAVAAQSTVRARYGGKGNAAAVSAVAGAGPVSGSTVKRSTTSAWATKFDDEPPF